MEFNKKYFVKTAPLVLSIGIFMGGIFAGCGPVKTRGGVNDVNLQESDMPAANNEPREERIMENFRALAKPVRNCPKLLIFWTKIFL